MYVKQQPSEIKNYRTAKFFSEVKGKFKPRRIFQGEFLALINAL